jgi:hypothetical protein
MSNDLCRIQQIKTQTLTVIARITANPKPSYAVDGQQVSWESYLAQLQSTIDWCDQKIAAYQPFEGRSQGFT